MTTYLIMNHQQKKDRYTFVDDIISDMLRRTYLTTRLTASHVQIDPLVTSQVGVSTEMHDG